VDWPAATRWQLTAPESRVLLDGAQSNARDVFKLGVTELIVRGALAHDQTADGEPRLSYGAKPDRPKERVLEAFWDLYHAAGQQTFGDGVHGTLLADLVKALQRGRYKNYGSLPYFVRAEVWQALIDRGLYEWHDVRLLFLLLKREYRITPEGETARAELRQWLELGQDELSKWVDDEPSRALDYARLAGAALLLAPWLFPDVQRIQRGVPDDDGGTDGWDLGGLGFDFGEALGGLENAMSSLESSFESAFQSSGDTGGSSDSGGGWDSGGGSDFSSSDSGGSSSDSGSSSSD
jgi:uncharacterized membrane protein YgcG